MGDFNGDSNDGAGNTTPNSTSGDTTNDGGVQVKYPEGLAEEFHGNPILDSFVNKETGDFNTGAALQSLIHAQKMIGGDKISLPSKDAGQEEWSQIYKKLGLPEDTKDYKIDVEGLNDQDTTVLNGFIDTAHKNGILPHQAKEVVKYFKDMTEQQNTSWQAEEDAKYNDAVNALKTEWGDSFKSNSNIANEAIKSLASEGTIKTLNEKGFFADPDFTKFAYELGKTMLDDDSLSHLKGPGFQDEDSLKQQYQESYGIVQQGERHPQFNYHRQRLGKLVNEMGNRKIKMF